MKTRITKRPSLSITVIILSVLALVSVNSCQKEINAEANKTNDALTANAAAGSKIIYTDVNPDSTVYCHTFNTSRNLTMTKYYNLDLNNDGISDFVFQIYYRSTLFSNSSVGYVLVSPATGSVDEVANSNKYPSALDTLTVIGGSHSKWSGVANQTLEHFNYDCNGTACTGTSFGNWTAGAVKYLGLKLVKSENIYYGWVRLKVIAVQFGSELTVMDYAYNSAPNKPILAGQMK
jgi:hypothetical protein